MTKPRIEPTKAIRHKKFGIWHLDEHWPGLVYSTWNFGRVRIRRERKYKYGVSDPWHTAWQLWVDLGRTTVGFRTEHRA